MRCFSKWVSWLKKWPREETYHTQIFFHVLLSLQRFIQLSWGGKISPIQKNNQWIISRSLIDEERVVWYNQSTKRRNNNLPTKNTLPILKLSFRNEVEIKNFKQTKLRGSLLGLCLTRNAIGNSSSWNERKLVT